MVKFSILFFRLLGLLICISWKITFCDYYFLRTNHLASIIYDFKLYSFMGLLIIIPLNVFFEFFFRAGSKIWGIIFLLSFILILFFLFLEAIKK